MASRASGISKLTDVTKLIRSHLSSIKTYTPVDPAEELARRAGISPEEVVKLNGNENPFGAHPEVAGAIGASSLHLYPDPNQNAVRKALADYTGMPFECLLAGAGGDELIDLLLRLFVEPGERLLDCEPTFGMYSFCARVADAQVISVPRDENFDVDIDAVAALDDERTKILFLASPNNPTGNDLSEAEARRLLEMEMVLVVDETYFEFSGKSLTHLVPEYENLVILRSMSKWAGLAGVRIGYMIASPEIVRHLFDIKQPYSVSAAAEAALITSLEFKDDLMKNVKVILEQRGRLEAFLDTMDGVKYWPSSANFLLCEFEQSAGEVFDGLASHGVFVRMFSHPRLARHLRISAGTPGETGRLMKALKTVI